MPRILGRPAGRAEGAAAKNILHNPKKVKSRPNSTGSASLKTPSFGKVAGRSALRSGKPASAPASRTRPTNTARNQITHGSYIPGFFKRGHEFEFELSNGEKGSGKIRDTGSHGIQVMSNDGRVLHVFYHEIKGKVEKQSNAKTKK